MGRMQPLHLLPSGLALCISVSGLPPSSLPRFCLGSALANPTGLQLWPQGSRDVQGPFCARHWGPKSDCPIPLTETNDISQHRCFRKEQ